MSSSMLIRLPHGWKRITEEVSKYIYGFIFLVLYSWCYAIMATEPHPDCHGTADMIAQNKSEALFLDVSYVILEDHGR